MAKKNNNRYRPPDTRINFHNAFEAGAKTVVFVDTETEGLDSTNHHIIQFAAVKYLTDADSPTGLGEVVGEFNTYIQTPGKRPLEKLIVEKTKITDEILENAPTETAIFPAIFDFMKDCDVFVAYNEPFDYGFVSALYERNGQEFMPSVEFDVMAMVCDLITMYQLTRKDLGAVAGYLKLKDDETLHDAMSDIRLTAKVFGKLYKEYAKLPVPVKKTGLPIPRIYKSWTWQSPMNYRMNRIYFATSCGKIFFEVYDRSFGVDQKEKAYTLDELDMASFVKQALIYCKCGRIEDLAHLKAEG